MTLPERPKLRPVDAVPMDVNGERLICLRDGSGLTPQVLGLPPAAFFLAAQLDGAHTLRDAQAEYVRRFGDLIPLEKVQEIVEQLDQALFLEGARFEAHRRTVLEEFRAERVRKAAHAGAAYPRRPEALRERLEAFFAPPDGPGPIDPASSDSRVAAIAAPHIDLARGGPVYAHAYKALLEGCRAETFVVLGTLHQPAARAFVPTDKDFATPLGTVACDRPFIAELARRAGLAPSDDELAHRSEHSIEFQAVFLRHLYGASRPVRIAPILCGPLLPQDGSTGDPRRTPEVAGFIEALRALLAERGPSVAVIASIDLSHVGRRFGDALELTPNLLAWLEGEDRALLRHAEALDAEAFYEHDLRLKDRTHVCGFPALYTLLRTVPARRGRLLHYRQAPEPETQSVVTFAAMAFER